MSSISQEWKDEKRDLLTEGQSFSSLDEEGKDMELRKRRKDKSSCDFTCISNVNSQ